MIHHWTRSWISHQTKLQVPIKEKLYFVCTRLRKEFVYHVKIMIFFLMLEFIEKQQLGHFPRPSANDMQAFRFGKGTSLSALNLKILDRLLQVHWITQISDFSWKAALIGRNRSQMEQCLDNRLNMAELPFSPILQSCCTVLLKQSAFFYEYLFQQWVIIEHDMNWMDTHYKSI